MHADNLQADHPYLLCTLGGAEPIPIGSVSRSDSAPKNKMGMNQRTPEISQTNFQGEGMKGSGGKRRGQGLGESLWGEGGKKGGCRKERAPKGKSS